MDPISDLAHTKASVAIVLFGEVHRGEIMEERSTFKDKFFCALIFALHLFI